MRVLNADKLLSLQKYIVEFQRKNGCSPTYRQILRDMDMSSLNLVQRYVLELERLGRITRSHNGQIEILPQLNPSEVVMTYLVGDIACGCPTEEIQNIEECYPLPKTLFGDGELFMVRTFGDSMVNIGITEGDLVVIKQQNVANDGEVAAVLVNGESTLKRIFFKGNKIILHPENETMNDIVINAEDCIIQGVLVSCIKLY